MKQLKIPTTKARNLEELEKLRETTRASILFWKRYEKYFNVESYLQEAMDNAQEIQKILDSIPIVATDISSGDITLQCAAVAKIKFIIVFLDDPDGSRALVQRGIIPHLLRFLENCDGFYQIKAAEVLVALLYGPLGQAQEVIDHGGAATMVHLLHSGHREVKIQTLRAMSRASYLSLQYRDGLISHGVFTQLAVLLEQLLGPPVDAGQGTFLLEKALDALLSFFIEDPLPDFHQVEIVLPIVQRIMLDINPVGVFAEICTYACLTMSHMLRRLTNRVQDFVNANFCRRLTELMQVTDTKIVQAVHLVVRKIISSAQAFAQVFIDNGILPALDQNLNDVPAYQKEACLTINAIMHRMPHNVQMLFDWNLIQLLLHILQDEFVENEIQEMVMVVLSGAAKRGSDAQIDILVNHGCIQLLCQYLHNMKLRISCILGLRNIIRVGNRNRVNGVNIYAATVLQFGGETLRALRDDADVGEKARWILLYLQ